MKKLLANRGFLGVLIVIALVAGVAIGGAFFARTVSDEDDGTASAQEAGTSTTTASTVPAGSGDAAPPPSSGSVDPAPAEPPGVPADPAALRYVAPANGPEIPWDYSEPENAPGPLPPALPVDVELSSTTDLRPGDAVRIRVTGKDGSQMFGFRARLCKKDARIENLYDFFPTIAPNCIANPLGAGTDAYVEVQSPEPRRTAEGAFRVGLGTDSFSLEEGGQASVTCSRAEPCQLVLQIHVPYGFGYAKYDLTFA
jgi:hypothetical protein